MELYSHQFVRCRWFGAPVESYQIRGIGGGGKVIELIEAIPQYGMKGGRNKGEEKS